MVKTSAFGRRLDNARFDAVSRCVGRVVSDRHSRLCFELGQWRPLRLSAARLDTRSINLSVVRSGE